VLLFVLGKSFAEIWLKM